MACDPITLWQVEGGKVETVIDFISLSSEITGDIDCSHKIERHLFLERKAMTNLDNTLETKVHIVEAIIFQ